MLVWNALYGDLPCLIAITFSQCFVLQGFLTVLKSSKVKHGKGMRYYAAWILECLLLPMLNPKKDLLPMSNCMSTSFRYQILGPWGNLLALFRAILTYFFALKSTKILFKTSYCYFLKFICLQRLFELRENTKFLKARQFFYVGLYPFIRGLCWRSLHFNHMWCEVFFAC